MSLCDASIRAAREGPSSSWLPTGSTWRVGKRFFPRGFEGATTADPFPLPDPFPAPSVPPTSSSSTEGVSLNNVARVRRRQLVERRVSESVGALNWAFGGGDMSLEPSRPAKAGSSRPIPNPESFSLSGLLRQGKCCREFLNVIGAGFPRGTDHAGPGLLTSSYVPGIFTPWRRLDLSLTVLKSWR